MVRVIDDEGRVFGVVNVIDALVVLLVAAVVVAGLVFVFTPDPGVAETRYVTIDLGEQPPHVLALVSAGDVMEVEGHPDNLSITDVYRGPGENGTAHALVRAEVRGQEVEVGEDRWQFEFAGEPLRVGNELTIETLAYAADGMVIRVDADGASLATDRTPVVVDAVVPTSTAAAIQPGDTHRIADTTALSVETVTVYPTATPDHRRVVLGLDLYTHDTGEAVQFGDHAIATGGVFPVETSAYAFDATVIRRGTHDPPGEPTTVTVTLQKLSVPPERVERIQPGLAETLRDTTHAELTDVEDRPARVVLESEDGNIFLREHPVNRDITITADLHARTTPEGLRFHGDPLREGETVTLDLGRITITAEVVELRA